MKMPRQYCLDIAAAIASGNTEAVLSAIEASRSVLSGVHWKRDLDKLAAIVQDDMPRFNIFGKSGNSKLPFVSFSTLPAVTCPGAGNCLEFCYSFTAWRYPAAFCKQAQNCWLMQKNKPAILEAWNDLFKIKKLSLGFDFRLYVDGDFSSVQDVSFWMTLLKSESTVRAYGYSKSFHELLAYNLLVDSWPTNYKLNISSGHKHSDAIVKYVEQLPITRGHFKAVNVSSLVGGIMSVKHGSKETNSALRQAYGKKAFTCPGKCGECTPKGHACGMSSFNNVDIIIAVH